MSGVATAAATAGALATGVISKVTAPKAQQQQSTQTTSAPSWALPYQQQAAAGAANDYGSGGPQLYQGPTVAPTSGATQQAQYLTTQRALNGSPLIDQASGYVSNGLGAPISSQFGTSNPYASPVATGNGTNPFATSANPFGGATNPYLDQTYNKALGSALQGVESQYARGGRNISSSLPVAGDIASNLASQIYAPAYESERNRQLSYSQQQQGIGANTYDQNQSQQLQAGLAGQQIGANAYNAGQDRQLNDISQQRSLQQNLLGYTSPLAGQDYANLAALSAVGGQQDQYNQANLQGTIDQFNQQATRPYQATQNYISQLGQLNPGQTTTSSGTSSAPPVNYGAAAIGGGLLGNQLYQNYQASQPKSNLNYSFAGAPTPAPYGSSSAAPYGWDGGSMGFGLLN